MSVVTTMTKFAIKFSDGNYFCNFTGRDKDVTKAWTFQRPQGALENIKINKFENCVVVPVKLTFDVGVHKVEETELKYWLGPAPEKCDTCGEPIYNKFYDAKTNLRGMWACMCPKCQRHGPGLNQLGSGKGQEYKKHPDGTFYKSEG